MVCICKINVQLQLQKTDRRNYKLITTTHKAKKYEEYNLVPNYHQCCNIEHSRWVSFKIQSQCSGSLMEKILIFTAKCAAPSLTPKEIVMTNVRGFLVTPGVSLGECWADRCEE